ncbi:MAG TPA: DUF1003 domain-containing protein [Chitinophagales bacterium]|nr:DUF1003 domain-containing protein [Chitinophagales bacterium]HNA57034.1 DUF1003 domain-containing protein [Chitinophagales bacterium]HNF69635.1 DUF1003 domain-containing protein [Chitinophagales bacterium]HNI53916.1 DUF1003 domain-containing protein [Chitinophagales bacterium]HNJ88289.1 DUF1003 domain-containing protein [Chitinophagales bacterium]
MQTFKSDLSDKEFPIKEMVYATAVRPTIMTLIKADHPAFDEGKGLLSLSELSFYREKYIADYLKSEIADLSDLEHTVVKSLQDNSLLSDRADLEGDTNITTGQRLADNVARFGGSWRFIILFGLFLAIWIMINALLLSNKGFDPYPFILLNLMLSCLAAIQAPLIMMSQNRQEEKDRQRAKKDYMINLKSEMEIRLLHEKLDHLLMHQQQKLLEIQQFQIEMMNDIYNRLK